MFAKVHQYLPFLHKEQPTHQQIMSLRPLRNPAVRWERQETDDLVVITFSPRPLEGRLRIIDRIFSLPTEKKIELSDELSSGVWEMCDGRHTVGQIAVNLAHKYKLGQRQAEVSVLAFLKTLQSKRLVGLPANQARALTEEQKAAKSNKKPLQPQQKGSTGFYAQRKELRKAKAARHRAH